MSAPSCLLRHTILKCSPNTLTFAASFRPVSFARRDAAVRFYAAAAFRARAKKASEIAKQNAEQIKSDELNETRRPPHDNQGTVIIPRSLPEQTIPEISRTKEVTEKPVQAASHVDSFVTSEAEPSKQNKPKPSREEETGSDGRERAGIERLLVDLLVKKTPLLYEAPNQRGIVGICAILGLTLVCFAGGILILLPGVRASGAPEWVQYTYTAVVGAAIGALGFTILFAPANMIKTIRLNRSGDRLVLQAQVLSHLMFRRKLNTRIIELHEFSLSEPVNEINGRHIDRVRTQKAKDEAAKGIGRLGRKWNKSSWNIFESISVAIIRDGLIDVTKNGTVIGKLDARGWCAQEGMILDRIAAKKW